MKRIIAIGTALLLLLSITACGQSAAPSEPAASTAAESVTEPSAPEPETAEPAAVEEETAEASDAEASAAEPVEPAATISYPLCEPGEITFDFWMQWPPFLQGEYDPNTNPFFAALEEATGVKLNIITCSTESVSDNFTLMVASNSFYDIMQNACMCYPGGGTKAVEDEVFVDLLPLLEENMPAFWSYMQDDAVSKNVINDEGYVPQLLSVYTDDYYMDQALWVRQDWLNDLNMEKPETLDQFVEMLEAFKSNEGASEPFTVLSEGCSYPIGVTFGANPGGLVVDDGTVSYSDITENGREYLRFIKQLYDSGLISKDFTSYNTSMTKPPEDVVLNGLTGCFNEDVDSITSYTTAVEGMDLRALQSPVLEAGEKLNMMPVACKSTSKYNISIASSCEDPETVLQMIDYMFTEEGRILGNYGTEDLSFTYDDAGKPQFTEAMLNNEMGFQIAQLTMVCPGFVRIVDWDVTYLNYNDAQREAVSIWISAFDSSDGTYPGDYVSYTSEESETMTIYQSDIETYCEECRLKFIVGTMDLETDWDAYVAAVEEMGVKQITDIAQSAYDRYMSR